MEFEEWKPLYNEIVKEFGFSVIDDRKSAIFLESHLEIFNLDRIEKRIKNKEVIVVGNSPQLHLELKNIDTKKTIISADAAAKHLLEKEIISDIICTDLDGSPETACRLSNINNISIIHAHGDNKETIEEWINYFNLSNSIGTTQTRPFGNIYNFGGFTDGDRCVFLADHFGAKSIDLIGFNFENPRYNSKIKKKKLEWARKLIKIIEKNREEKLI